VPLTTTLRRYASEVTIGADAQNGLGADSAAHCQHIRAVVMERVHETIGNVGAMSLRQIRETVALILDL
jgi:mRNA interferase MazF